MGVVINQTYKNTLIIFLGFLIGGINVLFLYTHFLKDDYYGLVTFLLSTANILMPLMVFGIQHTIIKFFSSFKEKRDRDNFLITAILLPVLIIVPLGIIGGYFYESIADYLSKENIIIKKYTYLIFLIAIFMGYFEIFYAWSKVQMQSVFGNFIREVFARISVSFLLIAVYFGWLTNEQFIYALVFVYFIRFLIMKIYAFRLYLPEFKSFSVPGNIKEILSFSLYIIMAGSAGSILLEIDKFMIPQLEQIAQVAYYAVGVYIASVIAIPSRAMQQIVNPITAKALNSDHMEEVESLYKKSSLTLLIAGGLLFLLININVKDLYVLIDKPEYTTGILVVLIISVSELIKLAIGTNGTILINSKYYRIFFYFSIAMALSVIILNRILIESMGINGAALATMLVVLVFSVIKIVYVEKKMRMQPFSGKTVWILLIISMIYLILYFVDFFSNPVLNILSKSLLILFLYLFLVIRLRISKDFNLLIAKILFDKKS